MTCKPGAERREERAEECAVIGEDQCESFAMASAVLDAAGIIVDLRRG